MRIRHMGYDFNTLRETINEMVEKLPLTVESMNKFKNTELSEPQKYDLARDKPSRYLPIFNSIGTLTVHTLNPCP